MQKKRMTKNKNFDFDDINLLMKYLDDQKRILPNKITKLSIKNQRKLAKAVKRARIVGILPYTVEAKY